MAQGFVGAAHDEDHSVASHDDTTATGTELETLTDGSDADTLHTHSADGIDTSAIHDNESAEISAVTEKVSPVGADVLLIEDSAAGNVKKRVQITNLPGGADADAIHDNVASEISAITAKATPVSGDFLLIEDSAAANAKKSMTVAALEAVLSHDNIAGVTSDDHHAESHNVASHSDTTATGAELETLTDGSNADSLHAHTASSPALDDITDVTITAVATNEVIAKSAGDWINRTLAEAGIEAAGTAAAQDHDHDTPIATHAALPNVHHTESHDVASHSDTTATGAELETLTDGSNADSLHAHLETEFVVFGETGDLEVKTGTHRFYLPYGVKIVEVEISVGTAPTGATAIVDVNVDGTTIFTTQSNRPAIAISGFVASTTTIEDDTHTDGQYLTVDIDQIGSSVAGADLTVVVRYEKV